MDFYTKKKQSETHWDEAETFKSESYVVVWIRMVPIDSDVCILGPPMLELYRKD